MENANDLIKSILQTIKDRCKIEASRKETLVPLSDEEARILFYTGLSSNLVDKLLSNKSRMSMLDIKSRILILETVKSHYVQNRMQINYTTIFEEIFKNGTLKTIHGNFILNLNDFINEMEILGYQWKETIENNKIIIEDPEIRFERYIYLNKLKNFRKDTMQWEQIVYVDERLINDTQHYEKPWIVEPSSKAMAEIEESVFYHAVSKTGFISGMFTNQASEKDFTRWLVDILLVHLKKPSVIIMDNNPMHGSLENASYITRYHTKSDMLCWLTNNNIPCSVNMSKPALFELIRKCNEEHREYKIDRMIRSHGHEILRLPCNFHDLSMTTPLWDNLIKNDGVSDVSTLMQLQNKLMKLLDTTAVTIWTEYDSYIDRLERELFQIDMAIEKHSDKYEFKCKNS